MKQFIGCILLITLMAGCAGKVAQENPKAEPTERSYASAKEFATEAYDRIDIISVCEYDQLVQSGKPHLLLDVREKKEVEAGTYERAIHLPRGVLEFKISNPEKWKTVTADRDHPSKKELIVVYCKSGLRSALAADQLQRLGFTDVKIIRGGWDQQEKGLADAGSQPVKRERPPEKIVGLFKSGEEMGAAVKPRCNAISAEKVDIYLATTPNIYLFDLRQPGEFKDSHIDGAILSPRGVFEFQVSMPKKWTKVKTDRPMPAKSDPIASTARTARAAS